MSVAHVHSKFISHNHTLRRAAVIGGATVAAMLLFAGSALAHITVTPNSVSPGSSAVLSFHVPNEEANAYTVKVDVQIPIDHPIAQLLVQPIPGWTSTVKTVTLAKPLVTDDGSFSQAVSEVIWSGGRILPGQFQSFQISADPMPTGESQMTFKAIQTYSNGDVVRWIDLRQPGQPAPAHPAPVVTLTTTTAATPVSAAHPRAAAPASSGSNGASTALGAAGLAVGLLACLLVLMVARQNRRPMTGAGLSADPPAGNGHTAAAGEQTGDQVFAGTKASARQTAPANTKASSPSRQPQRRRRG